jgi:tetratricopeptide (TPR) repeat protein
MEPDHVNRRKYPRIRAPKGMWVGWKSAGRSGTSRAENMGLGGLFLKGTDPLRAGSTIELIFELPAGEVRARAVVRRSVPGRGMGIQFIQMRPDDRARLNRYLCGQPTPQEVRVATAEASPQAGNSQLALMPQTEDTARARLGREVAHLFEVTGKGTYYQLLGVTSQSPRSEVKKHYYELARNFHPDKHTGDSELNARLKDLMTIATEAYKTLENEQRRAAYDKSLAASGVLTISREKTEAEESVEEWLRRANESLRANNFVGSVVWLRKCVLAMPQKAVYHAMLARSLATLTEYRQEAIEHFQTAIDLDPWAEPVYVQLAEVFERMRLPSRARAVYAKLLEINPAHARACERLADLADEKKGNKRLPLISQLFGRKH